MLDLVEMQAVFGGAHAVNDLSATVPKSYRKRISVFEVPASNLHNCSRERVMSALSFLAKRARREVEQLRSQPSASGNQRAGRLHALYAMLWMNAELAINRV